MTAARHARTTTTLTTHCRSIMDGLPSTSDILTGAYWPAPLRWTDGPVNRFATRERFGPASGQPCRGSAGSSRVADGPIDGDQRDDDQGDEAAPRSPSRHWPRGADSTSSRSGPRKIASAWDARLPELAPRLFGRTATSCPAGGICDPHFNKLGIRWVEPGLGSGYQCPGGCNSSRDHGPDDPTSRKPVHT